MGLGELIGPGIREPRAALEPGEEADFDICPNIKLDPFLRKVIYEIKSHSKLEPELGLLATVKGLNDVGLPVSEINDAEAAQIAKALGADLYIFDPRNESVYEFSESGKKLIPTRLLKYSPLLYIARREFCYQARDFSGYA
jgi:hypothetical protein